MSSHVYKINKYKEASMPTLQLNILLLCNKPNVGNDANTIVDHISAFEDYSNHHLWLCSNLGHLPDRLALERFDVLIIHYSMCLLNNNYISAESKTKICKYKGLKVVFIQDEYRQINKMNEILQFLNIDVLFTCFPESEIEKIYFAKQLKAVSKYTNLTGYIPARLLENNHQAPIQERPIDVGYRGRKLSYWYGELAFEKWNIVDKWFKHVAEEELKTDLSYNESDRLYGEKWIQFLSSCKTTLGVESGTSVMDFTGDLEKAIELYQLSHPTESFFEVQQKYLLAHEGKHKLNQISPRCFEAISLKTVLVLYEGEYSGILVAGRHYIMLKKDFSNIQEVLNYIRDDDLLQEMAERTYQEIALNPEYSYKAFVNRVDEVISSEFLLRNKATVQCPYEESEYQKVLKYVTLKNKLKIYPMWVYQRLPNSLRLLVKFIVRPKQSMEAIKLLLKSS
jgi:hypothetical protein